jgi:oxalate decarboxylase/phosphoglucose isomerase-like protein (cupin superfamily)
LPKAVAVRGYVRPVEDVFFVLDGCITVGWDDAGHIVEESLGPKDVIFNPAGRFHYFRNHGASDAEFMMLVGAAGTEDVRFHSA